jgi:hypothetical protein
MAVVVDLDSWVLGWAQAGRQWWWWAQISIKAATSLGTDTKTNSPEGCEQTARSHQQSGQQGMDGTITNNGEDGSVYGGAAMVAPWPANVRQTLS